MPAAIARAAATATIVLLVAYEALLAMGHLRRPERLARAVHAKLREEWFEAISVQRGSEIVAVQTLRNSLIGDEAPRHAA